MVQALKQTVRILPGGRIEVVSADLPEGREAEVIVLVLADASPNGDPWGLFADEPELLDRVVEDAMQSREDQLRRGRG
jgi:hypothetical protein